MLCFSRNARNLCRSIFSSPVPKCRICCEDSEPSLLPGLEIAEAPLLSLPQSNAIPSGTQGSLSYRQVRPFLKFFRRFQQRLDCQFCCECCVREREREIETQERRQRDFIEGILLALWASSCSCCCPFDYGYYL